jgi:hypothetical protein
MPYSADVRKDFIKKHMAEHSPIRLKKVFYKGKARELKVYSLPLDYLIFNQFNDRIAVEMRTREAMLGIASEEYTPELEDLICDILWRDRESLNRQTLKNLGDVGQQEPGVVTLDGVIIDGNRRAMLLKKHLKLPEIEMAVLEEELNNNSTWIRRLETQIQFGTDEKVVYEPLAKYLKIKEFVDVDKMDFEDIAPLFGTPSVSEIKSEYEIMCLMDEYLEYIGSPKIYTLLRFANKSGSREDSFKTLKSTLNQLRGKTGKGNIEWAYDDIDIDNYQQIYFDYIRSECSDPKDYRELAPAGKGGGNSGGIFMNESLFKELVKAHKEQICRPITENLEELSDYASKPEFEHKPIEEIAKARELDWQLQVKDKMKQNLKRAIHQNDEDKTTSSPSWRLGQAWRHLKEITEEDMELDIFINNIENQEIARNLNTKIYQIKKAMGS